MNLYVGIVLIVLGAVLIVAGRARSKRVNVHASHGSVAVGGDNKAPIINTNIGAGPSQSHGGHGLTILGIAVELVGIVTVIWHAWHLAHP